MKDLFLVAQIILSTLLVIFILLQANGTGFGNNWQGGGESYHTRRGLEKIVFYLTIAGTAFFILLAIANLIL